jgi:hypothetical protein
VPSSFINLFGLQPLLVSGWFMLLEAMSSTVLWRFVRSSSEVANLFPLDINIILDRKTRNHQIPFSIF